MGHVLYYALLNDTGYSVMRKLATIRRIDAVKPIPNADAIEAAVVGGWTVVVKKSEFSAGDLAVYLEVDSWVPTELAPFLSKGSQPREYNGVKGERLRTVKLRGTLSQGLLLSGTPCPTGLMVKQNDSVMQHIFQEGDDVSEWLGIQKWEAPIPAQLSGDVRGPFPSFIPKTDQERIQNLTEEFKGWTDLTWEITEKLDGSSMTVYHRGGDFGVCSRNWDLRQSVGNSFWATALRLNLEEKLTAAGDYALQGELVGEGIQGNPYRIRGQDFYVFDVYDIAESRYLNQVERQVLLQRLGLKSVPVVSLAAPTPASIQEILQGAEGKTLLGSGCEREGFVYKSGGIVSFKAISNRFLLKTGG